VPAAATGRQKQLTILKESSRARNERVRHEAREAATLQTNWRPLMVVVSPVAFLEAQLQS
jgi:hypothetical protein